jgi:hypothetical protein
MAKHPEKFVKEKEKELSKEFIKEFEKVHKDKDVEKIHKDKDVVKEHKEIEKIQKDKDIEKIQKDKDLEKIQKDKDKDKDAETQPGFGGDPVLQQAAFKFKDHLEKIHVEKVQKDKDHEFVAQAVAQPQAAAQAKLADKIIEKTHKDIEKIIKDKDFKSEKHEFKEWKDVREYVAGPVHVNPGDPVEARVAALEATVTQLLHFIPQELRPDLSSGALAAEKRGQTGTAAKRSKKAASANKEKK